MAYPPFTVAVDRLPAAGGTVPIRLKRIYDQAAPTDGARVLVDRLWPRGIGKAEARLTVWLKDIAPSPALRRWFGHKIGQWEEFRQRYRAELAANRQALARLSSLLTTGPVTLLFAARDLEHNHALVLAEYLHETVSTGRPAEGEKGQERAEPCSPVCWAGGADASYMGYLDRTELVSALNDLLAGERLALLLSQANPPAASGPEDALLADFWTAGAGRCRRLIAAIRTAGGTVAIGSAGRPAGDLAEPLERLRLLTRNARQQADKLGAILPRVQDDALHAQLTTMLAEHRRTFSSDAPDPAEGGQTPIR